MRSLDRPGRTASLREETVPFRQTEHTDPSGTATQRAPAHRSGLAKRSGGRPMPNKRPNDNQPQSDGRRLVPQSRAAMWQGLAIAIGAPFLVTCAALLVGDRRIGFPMMLYLLTVVAA